MLCGSLMILLGIGSIFAVHHWSTYAGFGVWVGFWVRKDINLMKLRVICRVDSNAGVRTFAFLLILHGSEKMLTYELHSPPKQYTF